MTKCPVCGREYAGGYCRFCRWERVGACVKSAGADLAWFLFCAAWCGAFVLMAVSR